MGKETALLTVELGPDGDDLYVTCDKEGLRQLIDYLQKLAISSKPLPNDVHLMTRAWAGNELSEDQQLAGGTLLHRVTVRVTE